MTYASITECDKTQTAEGQVVGTRGINNLVF